MNRWIAIVAAIATLGAAATVLKDWRWITPSELQQGLYTVASELEEKIGTEKARKLVKEAEDDERYWDQKVKTGMWHEPPTGSVSKKFWFEDQKKARGNVQYYGQRVRDLKK